MNTGAILKQLKAERTRIDRAIQALEALGDVTVARKPGGAKESPTSFNFGANKARGSRKMSAAARKAKA